MMKHADAEKLIRRAIELAEERNVVLSMAVCDDHGELIAFAKMDGVGLQTAPLARAKAYTAARMRKSTQLLGDWAREKDKDISNWVDPQITGLGGGMPIMSDGVVIGGMGVSGLSPQEDEEIVVLSIESTMA
ncbi:MAG: heme-binding protein [Cyclobacteriaceae bacterium]